MSNIQTFETYCPIFPGFYNTIFDESDSFLEYELSDEDCFREHYPELSTIPFDFIREHFWDCIDYSAGYKECAESIASAIPELFPGIVTATEYENLRCPREYNFANDSIDLKITVDLDAIHKFLTDNREAFNSWLYKRYTSRSGFISSYPNDVEGWEEGTENFTNLDGHYLGAILDFIAHEEESEPDMTLYYAANLHEAFSNGCNVDTTPILRRWEEKQETTAPV